MPMFALVTVAFSHPASSASAVRSDEPDHSESSSKMEATTYMKLHDFYRPSVVKLHRLAQEGIITPIPFSWKRQWELS